MIASAPSLRIQSLPESAWMMDWHEDESAIVVGASGAVYEVAEHKAPKVHGCVTPPPRTSVSAPWLPTPDPFVE